MTILHASIWPIIPVPEPRLTSYQLSAPCRAAERELVQFKGGEKQGNEGNTEWGHSEGSDVTQTCMVCPTFP